MPEKPKKRTPSNRIKNIKRHIAHLQQKLKNIASKAKTTVIKPTEPIQKTPEKTAGSHQNPQTAENTVAKHHHCDLKMEEYAKSFQLLCDKIHMLQKNLEHSAKHLKEDADLQKSNMQHTHQTNTSNIEELKKKLVEELNKNTTHACNNFDTIIDQQQQLERLKAEL